jgi:hypothetical protein
MLGAYYEDLYQRFDQCCYRGDKIPEIALDYAPLLASYPRPKVVYMLRNCFDVANSFKQRAFRAEAEGDRGGWPWHRASDAAVAEWSLSLRNSLNALDQLDLLFIVYESLFVDNSLLIRLFRFLDLPVTDVVAEAHRSFMRMYQDLENKRRNALTSAEKLYIMRNADFDAYRRALDIADRGANG